MLLLLLSGAGVASPTGDPGYGPSIFGAIPTGGSWTGAMPYYPSPTSDAREWVGAIVAPDGPPIALVGAAPIELPDPGDVIPVEPDIDFPHATYDPSTAEAIYLVDPGGGGDFLSLTEANDALSTADQWTTVYVERGHEYIGETFTFRNGLDAARPFSVVAHGSGARPVIVPRKTTFAFKVAGDKHDIYIRGLNWKDPSMDTTDPLNDGVWDRTWPRPGEPGRFAVDSLDISPGSGTMRRVSLVYCKFSYIGLSLTAVTPADPVAAVSDVTIYRNIFHENWIYTGGSRAQGVIGNSLPCRLAQNVIYHGGYGEDRDTGEVLDLATGKPSANEFNHNHYMSRPRNYICEGNVSIDASSIDLKFRGTTTGQSTGVVVRDNLIIGGEVGVAFGGQPNAGSESASSSVVGATVTENVILFPGQWQPLGRTLGTGISISSWLGGEITDNLMMGADNPDTRNEVGIKVVPTTQSSGELRSFGVTITGNGITGFKNDTFGFGTHLLDYTYTPRAVNAIADPMGLLPGGSKAAYVASLLAMDESTWDTDLMATTVNQTFRAAAGW